MKQQCYLAMIYLNWVVLAGGFAFLVFKGLHLFALAWLVVVPLAIWGYTRVFPSMSQIIGYGRITDAPARTSKRGSAEATLYTALGCPFCPVVKQRLIVLRDQMGFQLKEIDVTFKPALLAAKSIRVVPVIEAGERRLVGNATTEQLAELISGSSPS